MFNRFFHGPGMAALALTLLLIGLSAPAQQGDNNDNNKLSMMSAYQLNSFRVGDKTYRQAAFVGLLKDEGGKGVLMLDPNTCSLNDFGDALASTRLSHDHYQVELKRLATADPNKLRRYLYSITGEGLPKTLFLVVATGEETAGYRLVLGAETGGEASAVITLEPYSEKVVKLLFQAPLRKSSK